MPDVVLPDGRIITNVPEGITQEDLMERLGEAMPPEVADRAATVASRPPPREQTTLPGGPLSFGLAGLDAARSFLSEGPAAVAGGLAGIAASIPGGRTPAEAVEDVSGIIRQPPVTTQGQQVFDIATKPLQLFERGADIFSEKVGNIGTDVRGQPLDPENAFPGVAAGVKAGILGVPAIFGLRRGGTAPTPKQVIAAEAQAEGYVIPPGSVSGSRGTQALEGFVGKPRVGQLAAVENQAITNRLAARSLGLDENTVLTTEGLKTYRAEQGQAYAVLDNAGNMLIDATTRLDIRKATRQLKAASDDFSSLQRAEAGIGDALGIASDITESVLAREIPAASINGAIGILRGMADQQFGPNGNKSVARVYRDMAAALENGAERHLGRVGSPEIVAEFRQARQNIARSYDIQKALRNSDVDAHVIKGLRRKDLPLGPELSLIGRFAEEFPQASRLLKEGARPTSVIDALVGLSATGAALATGNPLVALPAIGVAARPFIRQGLLTGPGQRLARQSPGHPDLISGILASGALAGEAQEQ